ncbi:MAG: MMPL family transporter, partial [Candidatus Methanomethylophilaceae archaeon]|nr:MMPL family transporter [Candidatus Methanomethylophilaceae archaeon]
MKILSKAGGAMAKKPWVSLGMVILVTLVAFASIGINGVDFSMNEEDFVPENPIIEANEIVGEAFSITQSAISTVRADNVFTRAAFLSTLEYELAIMSDGNVTDYLIDPVDSMNSIQNPLKFISAAMLRSVNNTTLPTLPNLISFISNLNDTQIQTQSAFILGLPDFQGFQGLFTKDLVTNGSASASGALMILIMDHSKIVDDNLSLLNFETWVDGIAKNVSATSLAADNDIRIQILGENLLMDSMGDLAQGDLGTLFPLALLAIVAILILMYRDLIDMLVSVGCLIVAIIWTF